MSNWRDNLRTASFRGVEFKVRDVDTSVGRRNVLHQYPGKDEPYLEDMGLDADEFSVTGYVIQNIENEFDYFAERDALITALRAEGVGTLVHPFLGELQVGLKGKATIKETFDHGGIAIFTMTFVLAGKAEYPSSKSEELGMSGVAAYMDTVASESYAKMLSSFLDKYVVASLPDLVGDTALGDLASLADDVHDEISSVIDKNSSVGTDVLDALFTIKNTLQYIYYVPSEVTNEIESMFESFTNLVGVTGSLLDEADQTDAYRQQVTQAAINTSNYGDGLSDISVTTLSRAYEYRNRAATVNLVRGSALLMSTRLAVRVNYVSYDDADAMMKAVTDKIDAQLEKLGDEVGSQVFTDYDEVEFDNDDDFDALQRVRAAFAGSMRIIGANLAKVVNYEVTGDGLSTLALAYDLYKDLDRADEIFNRNMPIVDHPGFLPDGGIVQVLSE
jgi:prophage DNA circulation protein